MSCMFSDTDGICTFWDAKETPNLPCDAYGHCLVEDDDEVLCGEFLSDEDE